MNYESIQDRDDVGTWRVEAIDHEREGQVYTALFFGPRAKQRAKEYATFKNAEPCNKCGQSDYSLTGEHPCPECGIPQDHDDSNY